MIGVGAGEHGRRDEEVRRGEVVRDGDIIDLRYAEQGLHVRVVGLGRERIGKEDYHVYLSFRHLGAYLLVAAERAAEVGLYGQAGLFGYLLRRRSRSAEEVMGKSLVILPAPFHKAGLHLVMGDESDMLGGIHGLFHYSILQYYALK